MTKDASNKIKYKLAIFFEDDSTKNLLLKLAKKRGYEALAFKYPETCVVTTDPGCMCIKEHRCADMMILGRHFLSLKALDFLGCQSKSGCRVPFENKLIISSTYDEMEEQKGKDLGVKMLYMPFVFKELDDWFDECEKRLERMK
ncbi:MAG: hypothetical protein HZB36_02905 [Candidatus Omnitrophica bacterium]|nr:hypothetical protein [Candidatus Omnitrophota bacterium]